jgi:CubicO group peptidase (beta-lactamase class C family)
MPVDVRMRLESVSKLWTAVLVLQLAEHGRLSLDDTVARWLPGLLPFGDRITLRQLLTHTSGIFDNNDAVKDPARVLARVKDPGFHAELVIDELTNAVAARDPAPGVVFHADRGCQASGDYATLAEDLTVTLSSGRTGQCWDNALASPSSRP